MQEKIRLLCNFITYLVLFSVINESIIGELGV